jgi:BirA family transcriptional regulator, biotin operon repressor / biotin---[acetyl-CoA-carboxylase] ligase
MSLWNCIHIESPFYKKLTTDQAYCEETTLQESGDNLSELKLRDRISPMSLKFFETLPSTNRYVLDEVRQGNFHDSVVVLARLQTAGRGRREKQWESAAGNLAMTYGFSVDLSLSSIGDFLPRLAIVAATKVVEAIQSVANLPHLKIKWPNDLVLNERKLGGLLIETTPLEQSTVVAIGLGLNVNKAITLPPGFDQLPPVSLTEVLGHPTDLNGLVAAIVGRWQELDHTFETCLNSFDGLTAGLWRLGETMLVFEGADQYQGQLLGLNRLGGLDLSLANGVVKSFTTGTLRAI